MPKMPAELRAGLVARFDEASDKLVRLAEAIPADNAGAKPPFEIRQDSETAITNKAQVIQYLKRSSRHLGDGMRNLEEGGLRKPATMFKQETTVGNVFLFGVTHMHEHLGQLVSYARMNGVAPPWSAKE
jgi:uncharacterized damage-inducible protein DinB